MIRPKKYPKSGLCISGFMMAIKPLWKRLIFNHQVQTEREEGGADEKNTGRWCLLMSKLD